MTILAITGGIGGAKLALGLTHVLTPNELIFLANTGDDFEHLGLYISPDVDTLIYTLAGVVDPDRGWGRSEETWHCLNTLAYLGEPAWFRLGDQDLAVHIARTYALKRGKNLSEITDRIRIALGVKYRILPVSDDPIRTFLHTLIGRLSFQEYFVKKRCEPTINQIKYEHSNACLNPRLDLSELEGVIICPSNPYLSIGPMLAIDSLFEFLQSKRIPVVAVSPVVAGKAIKGPTAKIMQELGVAVSAIAVARHYKELINGFIVDESDIDSVPEIESMDISVSAYPSVMTTLQDRIKLARHSVNFVLSLSQQ
ncbi:MAG: 2-phospho-L-lactate transferase [Gammaproteobacteria bacterium]|nr:2-phospho-L-lactate transferase [Gammaproteobacteria bacterium]